MNLKICTEADLFQCVNLMKNFISSTSYANYLDIPYCVNFARMQLSNPNGVTIGLEKDGVLLGMLSAIAADHPFLPVVSTTDLCWWVEPQARNSRKAFELIKAYEYWAVNKKNAKFINLNSMNNERVDRLYERLGYKRTENVFTKEVT